MRDFVDEPLSPAAEAGPPCAHRAPAPEAGREPSATRPEDDIRPEPVRGLPEAPPEGEVILWQGRPSSIQLARDALNMRWVLGWFALLGLWRGGATLADAPLAEAARVAALYLATGALASLILLACATVMARATCYTITNRRVSMRIGAALTLHAQVPFSRIGSADVSRNRNGTGTVALDPIGESPLSYLVLWPHCRPWHARDPKPALRSIPDVDAVAELLGEAATGGLVEPATAPPTAPARAAARPAPAHAVPAE